MIEKKLLKPGDILLYKVIPSSNITAKFIGWAQKFIHRAPTKEKYCHLAIVDKDTDYVLEAKWPKTRQWKLDWEHLDKCYSIELWRVKGLTSTKVKEVLKWCHSHLGEWYDLGLFVFGWINFKHAEVCSTFVSKAFAHVKIKFQTSVSYGKKQELITPDEIASNSKILKRIV